MRLLVRRHRTLRHRPRKAGDPVRPARRV